jgi:hypothetical protein
MVDYRGAFDPDFRLTALSSSALAAVAREFQMQSHLLVSAAELALATRFDQDVVRAMLAKHWVGVAWLTSERLAARLGVSDGGAAGVAAVLALQADLPPGFDREVAVDRDRVQCTLTATVPELLDPEHPGSPGLLARGERSGWEAMAHGVDRRARLESLEVSGGQVVAAWLVDPAAEPATEPDEVALIRMSLASTWAFEGSGASG